MCSVLQKDAPCRAMPMVIATVLHLRVLSTVKSQGGLRMDSFALRNVERASCVARTVWHFGIPVC